MIFFVKFNQNYFSSHLLVPLLDLWGWGIELTNICDVIIGAFNSLQGRVLQTTTSLEFKEQMKQEQGEIATYKNALTDLGIDVTPKQ